MTADFHFDESKRFAENCEAFLETLKTDDPEMAAILRGASVIKCWWLPRNPLVC